MSIPGQAEGLLTAFVERQMHTANIPGVCLAVTGQEELLHLGTYGLADLGARRPVTSDHLFEIGSITKSFTAIALLQLYEQGVVDIHAPVTRYLPWFDVASDYGPITLHHLLSHTAGIITGTERTAEARYEVWALRETQTGAPPGTYFHYSNVGYKALGLVLEDVLGQSYGTIVRERILDPLGMDATEPAITHEVRGRLAVGYESYYDDRPIHHSHSLVPATWLETATADGSIAATATDLATYVRMFLNRGQGPRDRILSEQGFQLMTRPRIEMPEERGDRGGFYGYGLALYEEGGHALVGHDGGMVGYYSSILADLDEGLGVVVLTNGPGEPAEIARFVLDLLRGALHGEDLPVLPPAPGPQCSADLADFVGSYSAQGRAFALVVQGEQLVMTHGGDRVPLEERGTDRFYVAHPDFSLFLLCFGREEGRVVEAWHGPDWYVNERYRGPASFDFPPGWTAYPGHYRSYNPWHPNFRVVAHKAELVLVEPWGDEEVLVPLGDGLFRVGEDERSPERLRFDATLNGQALHVNLSGADYYRTFTP